MVYEKKTPEFKTIRQTAAMGILPEYRLRLMQKQNLLPGIQAGNRFLVNVQMLEEMLDKKSRENVTLNFGVILNGNAGE